ncbi:hypothetical protein RU639_002378 [Aspergillus parasiticus]
MESGNISDNTYEERRVLRRYNVSRSCIRCHQRKVRCDKSHPCTTCTRSNVTCRYPGSEKTKRRAPNVSLNEVAARLARLERTVSAIVGGDEDVTVPSSGLPKGGDPCAEGGFLGDFWSFDEVYKRVFFVACFGKGERASNGDRVSI